ncbi:MAG: class I SAM-dependent methyltransferase [Thermodesulfobacteriota bacterium]|nr:class I SAM-dependent methyltransferase [Thermodesulfobacteriota bacterium]
MKFKRLTEEEIKKIDDLQSEYFSKSMETFALPLPEGVSERLEKIVQFASISHSDTTLDIGTGMGILIPLIQKYEPAGIYANDLSGVMLEFVKRNYPNVSTIQGDIRDLKLPGNSIDVVFINACYPNIVDKYRCFMNIRRMLRRGGRIVISHPMGSGFIDFLKKEMPFPVEDFPKNRSVAEALFKPYGFNVAKFVNHEKLYVLVLVLNQGHNNSAPVC